MLSSGFVLTAIFSVAQDMTQQTPTQELIAKDLLGIEWPFKHIYRGKMAFPSSVTLDLINKDSCNN